MSSPKQNTELLKGLNQEQVDAVTHKDGPLLIVAGAGTGKTTVITRRIAYLIEQGVKPENILALTFADKAAEEMTERVDQLLPYGFVDTHISTFHAFGEEVLKAHGLEIGLPDFKVLDETGQWLLIRNNLDQFELNYYRPLGNPTKFIRALISHFSRLKDEEIYPEEYIEYAQNLKLNTDSADFAQNKEEASVEMSRVQELASAYHLYQRLLFKNGALDFGDLILQTLKLFRTRPKVLQKYCERFQYILVDEFQDTNYAQYELIKLLAPPKNNIAVVGDDDQSIFKFRGASISNIMHFKQDFAEAKFVTLTRNYRSHQEILDAAYKFIKQNDPDRLEVKLGIAKKLLAEKKAGGQVIPIQLPDYLGEADAVVKKIQELKSANQDLTWNDFAILARSHDALEPFIEALDKFGVPYIYFANKGLYKKPIIYNLLCYFKLLDNYHESSAFYRVLNLPVFGISHGAVVELNQFARRKSLSLHEAAGLAAIIKGIDASSLKGIQKLLNFIERDAKLAREKNVIEVFVGVFKNLEFEKFIRGNSLEGLQNAKCIETFSKKVQNFQNISPDRSLKAFMSEVAFEQEAGEQGKLDFDPDAGPEAVKLMTVHAAKGLEYAYVFVVGLVDKRFPTIERSEAIEIPKVLIKDILPEGDVHLEEERRLFYVAMTRAKNALYLTRALDYGGKLTKKPSRFLIELGLAQEEKAQPTGETQFKGSPSKITLPVPKTFSFSQISTFRSCPLEYKYRYVLGLPEPGTGALSFGVTIHQTFEKFLRLVKQGVPQNDLFSAGTQKEAKNLPNFEILKKTYEDNWIDDWFASKTDMEKYRKSGLSIIKNFYDELTVNGCTPKYLEESFKLKLKNGIFVGKIDRADDTSEGLVIIDYKTGQSRKIDRVDKEQLLVYQWAAQEYLKEKVKDLQYWFLKDKLEKLSFIGTDKDLEKLKADYEDTIAEIIDAIRHNAFAQLDGRISHDCKYAELEQGHDVDLSLLGSDTYVPTSDVGT